MTRYQTWANLNEEGKHKWGDIFPSGEVPVRSIITQPVNLEGINESERVFLVEWEDLTEEQKDAVLSRLSMKSGASKEVILQDILRKGLPLREKYTNGSGTTQMGLFV